MIKYFGRSGINQVFLGKSAFMLRFSFVIILSIGLLFFSCSEEKPIPVKPPEKFIYGYSLDSVTVRERIIKSGQNFGDILMKYGLDFPAVDELVCLSDSCGFSVRKMQAGKSYTLLMTKDSVPTAKALIYEINQIDYIVFDLKDSLKVRIQSKKSKTETHTASGVITNSLYSALADKCLNPVLAIELAEVYAWTIDFYRIHKGDKFKVVFEETTVDGESVGIGRIKSAVFSHDGEDFFAIYFEQKGSGAYYDEENRGLRNQFLKSPVKFSRISSRYTMQRFHPVQKRWKAHLGTDYACPTGTPIMSTANGVVIDAKFNKFNGNYVKVRHDRTYTTQYLHMSRIKPGVRRGKRVSQGDVIGYVGSTGLASGPHVCYRFWKNGRQVDALRLKLPKAEPISKKNLAAYESIKKQALNQLEEIKF